MFQCSRRLFVALSAATAIFASARLRAGTDLAALVYETKELLDSLESEELVAFRSEWPATHERRVVIATQLPVLRWLSELQARAPQRTRPLVTELGRRASALSWRQTYKAPDVSTSFLNNYGWTEIVGLTGLLPSERLACGFLLLGPATEYPRHRHEAEEIYVPLSGNASWQQGDGIWRDHPPGTVIHHASDEAHSMRTSSGPLLALYLWRSANLNQKSRLDHRVPGLWR